MKINSLNFQKLSKPLIIVLVILLIVLIAFWIYKKAKKEIDKTKQDLKDKQLVKQADEMINQGGLTYTEADYLAMADKLYIAMKGPGTDEEAIYEVIGKLKTASDWHKLVSTFGIRKSGSFSGNLVEWLVDELSDSERAVVNNILQKFNASI